MSYWLIKSEPDVFSIRDLAKARNKTTHWEGVRNYQARNFLRAMKKGDRALFYHSNATPSAVAGVVRPGPRPRGAPPRKEPGLTASTAG